MFLPEETVNWKAGISVSACLSCKEEGKHQTDTPKHSDTSKIVLNTTQTSRTKSQPPKTTKTASTKASTDGAKCVKESKSRNALNLQQRVELINYAKNNPNAGYRKVADKFGIGRTQAQKILRTKQEILSQYETSMKPGHQKRVRPAKYSDVNDALWEWYSLCRQSNIPVSDTMLQEEARLIAEKMEIKGFSASNGWLQSFNKQHNLHKMNTAGEDGDVNEKVLESWNERAREITREYKPEDVWNMDETGCFWKGLPDTSMNEKGTRCRGGKQAKQRNTWAFFVNAAGEKEDPIVIGRYAKPRCFASLTNNKRPYGCWYYSNNKAWMTTEVMKEVLEKLNAKLKRKGRKILLLMDNAPCHPHNLADTFSNITIKFLPKNTTSMTQPLDAGIIANWKVKYKKKLLRYVCSRVDGKKNASEIVKSVNVSMAFEWGKQAWDEVSSDLIVKCFKKTKLYPEEIDDEDDPFEGEDELPSLQYKETS